MEHDRMTGTAHHPDLYQTILAHPHEDAARLVYADWLEEHGDPLRATFIRLQCQLDTLDPWHDDHVALRERMLVIRQSSGPTWLEEHAGLKDRHPRFLRGFVGEISCSERWWLRQSGGLMRRIPLEAPPAHLSAVLATEATRQLSALHLRMPGLKRAHLELLAGTPLPQLRTLDLSGTLLVSGFLEPLLNARQWPAFRELILRRNLFANGGLGALGREPLPWQLTSLVLTNSGLERTGIDELFASPLLEHLQTLDLSENRIAAPGKRPTWQPTTLGGLRCLKLDQALSTGMVAELVGCPSLAGLRSLWLNKTHINPAAFKTLAAAKAVQGLQELRLEGNTIGDGGIAFLAHASSLSALNILDLSNNGLTSDGIARLTRWPGLAHVKELRLGTNALGDAGVRTLAECPALAGLIVLHLNKVEASDSGIAALATSPHLGELTTLHLGHNQITDASAHALMESKTLPHLRRVRLEGHYLSTAVRKAFTTHFVDALTTM